MPLITLNTTSGDRNILIHEGGELDAKNIFKQEEYNIQYLRFLKVENIIDVGAHVGLFSIFIRLYYPTSILHCYEPLKANLSLLRENLAQDENVFIHDFGLSSYNHQTDIWLSPQFGHGAASTMKTTDHSEIKETVKFVGAMEEFQKIEGRITILKIDTEGHELRILRNIVPILDRIDSLFLEIHSDKALGKIIDLLCGKFKPIYLHSIMADRYKAIFINLEAAPGGRLQFYMAPEIYYD
jgi:FkbM family methyltransferase